MPGRQTAVRGLCGPAPFVERRPFPLRAPSPTEKPAQEHDESPNDKSGRDGPLPGRGPERRRRMHFNSPEIEKLGKASWPGSIANPGHRFSLQPNLHRNARNLEGVVYAVGRPRSLGRRDGVGRKKATARSEAWEINDNPVAIGLHVNVFAVDRNL